MQLKGIALLRKAVAGLEKIEKQLEQAAKHLENHRRENDAKLATETARANGWIQAAKLAFDRAINYANAHRDRHAKAHAANDAVLTAHQERAQRVSERFKQLLA